MNQSAEMRKACLLHLVVDAEQGHVPMKLQDPMQYYDVQAEDPKANPRGLDMRTLRCTQPVCQAVAELKLDETVAELTSNTSFDNDEKGCAWLRLVGIRMAEQPEVVSD